MQLHLVLASLFVASAHAIEKCNYAVVAPNLHSLATPIAKCMTATGNSYNLARAEAPPTPEQAAAICSKCADFVADVLALPPWPECTLNVGGSAQTLTSYFDKMIGGCKSSGSEATAAPIATTAAPVPTTAAPAPATTKPTETTTTTSPSATTETSTTTPPSGQTTTPEASETTVNVASDASGSQGTEIESAGSATNATESSTVTTAPNSAPATPVPSTTNSAPSMALAASVFVAAASVSLLA